MKVRILYDERAREGFQAHPGFSCLIEAGENVLFDTGTDPAILRHNMQQAGVDPASIDKIVISHDHDDHAGGLPHLSANNARAPVFLLPQFRPEVRDWASPLPIVDVPEPREVSADIWSTGPIEGVAWEQALALKTDNGIVVLTGCAHPGVDAMIQGARPFGEICGVFGGFHSSDNISALDGIPFLAPCHCTQRRRKIGERWPEAYVEVKAGSVLEF